MSSSLTPHPVITTQYNIHMAARTLEQFWEQSRSGGKEMFWGTLGVQSRLKLF